MMASKPRTNLGTEVEIKDGVGVKVNGMETSLRAIDDLETLVLLHGEVNHERAEMQRRKVLPNAQKMAN